MHNRIVLGVTAFDGFDREKILLGNLTYTVDRDISNGSLIRVNLNDGISILDIQRIVIIEFPDIVCTDEVMMEIISDENESFRLVLRKRNWAADR